MSIIIFMKIYIPKPVIVCIGTPKVCGDSLGPIVGDLLVDTYSVDGYVYGKTSSPVTGINCESYYKHVRTHHRNSIIIAVDACLGQAQDVGKIKYSLDGLRAGSALSKNISKFGDVSLLGIVAKKSNDNLSSLVNADKTLVNSLAQEIAKKIHNLILNLRLSYIF